MIPFNRYWIVFYQTLQDYSGGVALVEPNKMRKGLASSSHRLKPLCVHTQRLVSLCLCHPFLFSSSTHSRRWEEWTLHWTNEGHALWVLLIASHPSLPPLHFKSGTLPLFIFFHESLCLLLVMCWWNVLLQSSGSSSSLLNTTICLFHSCSAPFSPVIWMGPFLNSQQKKKNRWTS